MTIDCVLRLVNRGFEASVYKQTIANEWSCVMLKQNTRVAECA